MARLFCSSFILLVLPVAIIAGVAGAGGAGPPHVRACRSVSLARPGFGVAYRGTVRNSDYRFSLVIPPGLTGWGAGLGAPFHGFTIFLPGGAESCIDFEIHLRVNLGELEEASGRHHGTRTKIGNATGWKEERAGLIGGISWTNVTIRFSAPRDGEVGDGSVCLVTPTKDMDKNLPIFEKFVSDVRFEGGLGGQ